MESVTSQVEFFHNYAIKQEIQDVPNQEYETQVVEDTEIIEDFNPEEEHLRIEVENDDDVPETETYYYTEHGQIYTSEGHLAGYLEDNALENLQSAEDVVQVNFRCSVCADTFFTYADLRIHSEEHHESTVFKCEKCNKNFHGHGSYWRHMKAHSDDPRYKFTCQICEKVFSQKANLMKHQNIHLGLKNFQCTICLKSFSQKANLKKHLLVHSGSLLFDCSVCGKKFSQKANLNKHYKIHLGDYAFQCEICGKKFIQKINCQKHMKTHKDMLFINTELSSKNDTTSQKTIHLQKISHKEEPEESLQEGDQESSQDALDEEETEEYELKQESQ